MLCYPYLTRDSRKNPRYVARWWEVGGGRARLQQNGYAKVLDFVGPTLHTRTGSRCLASSVAGAQCACFVTQRSGPARVPLWPGLSEKESGYKALSASIRFYRQALHLLTWLNVNWEIMLRKVKPHFALGKPNLRECGPAGQAVGHLKTGL